MRDFQEHPGCVRRHAIAALVIALLVAAAAACGSGQSAGSAPPPPALARQALPTMDVTAGALTATDLTHDAPIAGFADKLADFGYEAGSQREFRGRSDTFSTVVSRSLRFGSAAGARAYVQLVSDRVADFFGSGSKVRPLESNGRSGYLIRAASCGCHLETPILIAVVSKGNLVSWLYGTGRGAKPAALRALLERAP